MRARRIVWARCIVLVLWMAAAGLTAAGRAQLDVGADERERRLAAVEVAEIPLERRLVAGQELAVWLPEGFEEVAQSARSGMVTLRREPDGTTVAFFRWQSEPGTSLIQIFELLLESWRQNGETIDSVRRIRLASRHAIEITGTASGEEGRSDAWRAVVVMDPGDEHYRVVMVRQPSTAQAEPVDALFVRLMRDWSPLDASSWSSSFERLRPSRVTDALSVAWAQRNRLFDAVAQPDAVGQPWVGERLAALAEADPRLLFDGWFHHHPRVRIACVEALDPLAVETPARWRLFAMAMQDPDPAVRYRTARRIAAASKLAGETLDRILVNDSEVARGAAFQLLAALEPPQRAAEVLAAFEQIRQYPAASQPLLAVLLARWGRPEEAAKALVRGWKTSRQEALRRAALSELLAAGHGEALEAALKRLRQPFEPVLPELPEAARAIAVHASAQRTRAVELVAAALDTAAPEVSDDSAATDEPAPQLDESRRLLRELLEHWASLPADAVAEDECAALDRRAGQEAWVLERRAVQGCAAARDPDLVRFTLPRPGGFAAALLGLAERLDVGSTRHTEILHAALDQQSESLRRWAGDPVSSTSIGLDLGAALHLTWRPEEDGGYSDGVSLSARSRDPERFLDSFLRISASSIDLPSLATGLLAVHALPLVPMALFSRWDVERSVLAGEDSSSSDTKPPEKYVALSGSSALNASSPSTDGAAADRAEIATLYELVLGEGDATEWNLTRFSRQGDRLTLRRSPTMTSGPILTRDLSRTEDPSWRHQGFGRPRKAATKSPDPASDGSTSFLEIDVSGWLRQFDDDAEPSLSETVGDGGRLSLSELSLAARIDVQGPVVTTSLELLGLPEDWISAAVNVAPSRLRAPAELLPHSCLAWAGLSFDPAVLRRILEPESATLSKALGDERASMLLDVTEILGGEAGLALVDVPALEAGQTEEAWQRHLVVYFSVEPRAADRFLKRTVRQRAKPGKDSTLR